MSSSRNFIKEPKLSKPTSKYYGDAPLSGRTMNQNYYQDQQIRNHYASKEFKTGIFTNQLNRKAQMGRRTQQPRDLPLQVYVEQTNLKVKNSKRTYQGSRQSKEEAAFNYHHNQDYNVVDERQIKEEMRGQMQMMSQEIFQRVTRHIESQISHVNKSISSVIINVNKGFQHQNQLFQKLRNELIANTNTCFNTFSSQYEEKLQKLNYQISTMTVKKSKANGDYNMDLKNSFQGLNSSMSVNLGNQNHNSKLVNQVIFQLDAQKKELSQTKQNIDELTEKINSKMFISKIQQKQNDNKDEQTFKKDDIIIMMRQMLIEQRKKHNFDDKIQQFQIRIKQIESVIENQEQNIRGMNQQFKNTVNNQINPKLKKLQTSIHTFNAENDHNLMKKLIAEKVENDFQEKMKQTKVLRIRDCNQHQNDKLSVLSGRNQDKISYKQTYLLDQDNYLLDSQGNYLTQQIDNKKQRIKIDSNMLYLLQLKGIEIENSA